MSTRHSRRRPGPLANDNTIVPKPAAQTAPSTPASPSPGDGSAGAATSAPMSWSAPGATTYDVYFGTTNPPALAATSLMSPTYVTTLADNTTYYWQVAAHNVVGTTTGPLWSFTTAVPPPGTPGSPTPANGATGITVTPTLAWS